MKSLAFAALALILSSACTARQDDLVPLQAESHSGGPMYRWEITEARSKAQPLYKPSQGNPPLPVNKAVEAATAWLKKQNPEVKDFAVASVQLSQVGFGQPPADKWFYRIECNPVIGGRELRGGSFIAVVLFDGSVVEPRQEPSSRGK